MKLSPLKHVGADQLRRELAGATLVLVAVFLAIAMVGEWNVAQLTGCSTSAGLTGPAGACARGLARLAIGWPASLLIPGIPLAFAARLFADTTPATDTGRSWGWCLAGLLIVLPIGLGVALAPGRAVHPATGLWGSIWSYYLTKAFGLAGAWTVVAIAVSATLILTVAWNPIRALLGRRRGTGEGAAPAAGVLARIVERLAGRPARALRESIALKLAPAPEEMPAMDVTLLEASLAPSAVPGRARASYAGRAVEMAGEEDVEEMMDDPEGDGASHERAPVGRRLLGLRRKRTPLRVPPETPHELPTTELLTLPPARNPDAGRRDLEAMGVRLMDALATFRVEGTLAGYTTGPTVTQFEIEPAPGVKVRQFATLANDLALAMRAPSIRIVAPIPGRGAVGVEVPNPKPELVAFRAMLESEEFQTARMALPVALGKDLSGRPVVADLAKMPHLLIAGATGSGKSVCVNTIITSLLYRHTPETLRLLMVDPKMVELSVYNTLPHLRHKVVVDNRDAAAILKWAVLEMNERYALLAANNCRNLQDFNQRVVDGQPLLLPKQPNTAFEDQTYRGGVLPYIVLIIDEMADLMMTVASEVETPIAMLAQKARAIGIHLILATQRPSVNVITGVIKANFPSRIAFRVASQVDSRTIIDGAGAENLLGNGDMLFIPPGRSEPVRLQGAYLASEETERVMQWYEEQRAARRAEREAQGLFLEEESGEADILSLVRQQEAALEAADEDGDGAVGDRDKLFREAAEICLQQRAGSTSLLQRRMKIGYGRAARIVDQLADAGILGPSEGSKPRDVLVGYEDLDRLCGPRS